MLLIIVDEIASVLVIPRTCRLLKTVVPLIYVGQVVARSYILLRLVQALLALVDVRYVVAVGGGIPSYTAPGISKSCHKQVYEQVTHLISPLHVYSGWATR